MVNDIRFSLLLALAVACVLSACEGPEGPEGPMGPEGPQGLQGEPGPRGETGPPREGIIIERRFSNSLYDDEDRIIIEDDRIKPETFRAFYLKVNNLGGGSSGVVAYIPIEYIVIFDVSVADEDDEGATTLLAVREGALVIVDLGRTLLDSVEGLLGDVDLAILVSQ